MSSRPATYTKSMLTIMGTGLVIASMLNVLAPDVVVGIVGISHGYALYTSGVPLSVHRRGTLASTLAILGAFTLTILYRYVLGAGSA